MRSWGSAFDRMIAYVIAAAAVLGLVGLGAYDLLGTHGSASPAAAGATSDAVTSTTVDPATTADPATYRCQRLYPGYCACGSNTNHSSPDQSRQRDCFDPPKGPRPP